MHVCVCVCVCAMLHYLQYLCCQQMYEKGATSNLRHGVRLGGALAKTLVYNSTYGAKSACHKKVLAMQKHGVAPTVLATLCHAGTCCYNCGEGPTVSQPTNEAPMALLNVQPAFVLTAPLGQTTSPVSTKRLPDIQSLWSFPGTEMSRYDLPLRSCRNCAL